MIRAVGIISTGDMGRAVGNVLRHHGLRVLTCLNGRSQRTVSLAASAGIEAVPDDETLLQECDIFLSIVPPDQAGNLATRIGTAIQTTGIGPLFVDCNATAPGTVREIEATVRAAGIRFVDVGIIGSPPEPGKHGTRFFASGLHASEFAALSQYGLDIRVLGDAIGQASGIKMCYAALTKGLSALATELLAAGTALGLAETLKSEIEASQPALFNWMQRQLPTMPPKAYRWVGEMEEVARTFGDLGSTPRIPEGAADLYRLVAGTVLGEETPEQRHRGQTLDDVVTILADALVIKGRRLEQH